MEEIVVGIDLGTTNCRAAIWRNKKVEIICDKYGNRNIPSIVAFNRYGRLTGIDAKKQLENNPFNSFYDIKRLIGKNYSDISVQNDKEYLTYKLVKKDNDNIGLITKYSEKILSPEELISYILVKVKKIANSYIQNNIDPNYNSSKVVITIPAYFNDSQRQATLDAANIAGLDVIRMINEPTAAALSYGINTITDKDRMIMVYDLGGGTLDISLMSIETDGLFKVIATSGNTHLGGEDLTECLFSYILNEFLENEYFKDKLKVNKKYYEKNLQKLRKEIEKAKIELSKNDTSNIFIESFYQDIDNNIILDINTSISKKKYETIANDIFNACIEPIYDILQYTKINVSQIDEIILVGGPTRTPKIQEMIYNIFHKKPVIDIDPESVVATGAAIQGYMINNKDDPFMNDIVLLDVCPLTLGIETEGGLMIPIIEKNSTIPITRSNKFSTSEDNMEQVEIKIYEGERKLVKDNHLVGKFILDNIQKAPKGVPAIIVKIHIDVNGIIKVSAFDKKIGDKSERSIKITGSNSRLSKEEINRLIKEGSKYETEDSYKQKLIELFNEYRKILDMVEYNVFKNDESKLDNREKDLIITNIKEYNNYFTNLLIDNEYYDFNIIYNNSEYIGKYPSKLFIDNLDESDNKNKYMLLQYIINHYNVKLKQMNRKYANLVIQLNNIDDKNIKTINTKNMNYDDIDDNIDNLTDVFNNITDFKLDINIDINIDDPNDVIEKKELLDLIGNINNFVNNNKLDEIKQDNIREYINNTIIWMKINKTIDKNQYKDKYNEMNLIIGNILS